MNYYSHHHHHQQQQHHDCDFENPFPHEDIALFKSRYNSGNAC
jgi:hypothetical protein